MQMVFQNPYSSMNPRMKVRDIIAEPIRFHKLASSESQIEGIVSDLLDHVGLGRGAGRGQCRGAPQAGPTALGSAPPRG